jgi:hypothetical protein
MSWNPWNPGGGSSGSGDSAPASGFDYGQRVTNNFPLDYRKTPDETIRAVFLWALKLQGESISSTTYTFPDGLTQGATAESGTERSVMVSGGEAGNAYRVKCLVTTSGGQVLSQTKVVSVEER